MLYQTRMNWKLLYIVEYVILANKSVSNKNELKALSSLISLIVSSISYQTRMNWKFLDWEEMLAEAVLGYQTRMNWKSCVCCWWWWWYIVSNKNELKVIFNNVCFSSTKECIKQEWIERSPTDASIRCYTPIVSNKNELKGYVSRYYPGPVFPGVSNKNELKA